MVEALVAVADAFVHHRADTFRRLLAAGIQRKVRHRREDCGHICLRRAVVAHRAGDQNQLAQPNPLLQRAARADADCRGDTDVVKLLDRDACRASADAGRQRQHVYPLISAAQTAELAVIRQLLHVRKLLCNAVESCRIAGENGIADAERLVETNVCLFHKASSFPCAARVFLYFTGFRPESKFPRQISLPGALPGCMG